jgi:hypothetical protein
MSAEPSPDAPYRRPLPSVLHRVSGSVEVARDLLGRSGTMYLMGTDIPDSTVVDRFTRAAEALALVAEALEGEFGSPSM